MFSLIIVIISLAIAAALAYATVFFGGSNFLEGRSDAEVSRYLSESQQIAGAVQMFQVDNMGQMPTDLREDLRGHYLKDIPEAGADWVIGENMIVKAISDQGTCERVNMRANWVNPDYPGTAEKHEPATCDVAEESASTSPYYCCIGNNDESEQG